MKANIAYKFELMPTREQKRIFAQAAGCRRFVWNKAIELQKRCLEQEVPFLKEALQKPLFSSRIEQNCSVRFFFTTSKNGVFCHQNSIILSC